MRTNLYILIILLIIWLIGGTYWYVMTCCDNQQNTISTTNTTQPLTNNKSLEISDALIFKAAAPDNIIFSNASATPQISTNVNNALQKTVTYLQANPIRQLTLTGLYETSENNSQLGIERANAVKKVLVGMGLNEQQLLTTGKEQKINWNKNQLEGGINFSFKNGTSVNPLTIKDNDGFNANTDNNLIFAQSGFEPIKPINKDVEGVFAKVANYLKQNPNKKLTLKGFYQEDETNTSILPNLGIARANAVKQLLTKFGANAQQIDTEGELTNINTFNNHFGGGINYMLSNMSQDDKTTAAAKLKAITQKLKNKPQFIYFDTGKTSIKLDKELRQYLADLIYYLDKTPSGKVIATGHTDNVGNPQRNLEYGNGRAQFVKNYLSQNGADLNRIETNSKGQTLPIATNNTAEGRAKNRRVEIAVK